MKRERERERKRRREIKEERNNIRVAVGCGHMVAAAIRMMAIMMMNGGTYKNFPCVNHLSVTPGYVRSRLCMLYKMTNPLLMYVCNTDN
jgi:hypothetical protein